MVNPLPWGKKAIYSGSGKQTVEPLSAQGLTDVRWVPNDRCHRLDRTSAQAAGRPVTRTSTRGTDEVFDYTASGRPEGTGRPEAGRPELSEIRKYHSVEVQRISGGERTSGGTGLPLISVL